MLGVTIIILSGVCAAMVVEALKALGGGRSNGGRIGGRLFVSDANKPRHRAARIAIAAARWTLIAAASGAAGIYLSDFLRTAAGVNGAPDMRLDIALAITAALFAAAVTESGPRLVRGIAATLIGGGGGFLLARWLYPPAAEPEATASLAIALLIGLPILLIWRLLGLIPPLQDRR